MKYQTDLLNLTCEDNMELMARYPDKYFDLAIVDPPYGISINENMGIKKGQSKRHTKKVRWDDDIPSNEYFKELIRVSKNQIIWGGNYFPCIWTEGCKHFIFWYKKTPDGMSFSDGELAWTSFNRANRMFTMYNVTNDKIHPTQKPVQLYKWLLDKYAKEGDKILDTHLGSMSIAIACHYAGYHLTGCELDPEYFEQGVKRVKEQTKQLKLI